MVIWLCGRGFKPYKMINTGLSALGHTHPLHTAFSPICYTAYEMAMERKQLSIPQNMFDKLNAIAKIMDTPANELIRQAITIFIRDMVKSGHVEKYSLEDPASPIPNDDADSVRTRPGPINPD